MFNLRVVALRVLAAVLLIPTGLTAATIQSAKKFGEPRRDKALVYAVREKAFVGSAVGIFVFSDDQLIGFLRNNTYTFAYVEPGAHMIWGDTDSALDMHLVAGETYYVSARPANPISLLSESAGKAAIEKAGAYIENDATDIENGAERVAKRYEKTKRREAASDKAPVEELPPAATAHGEGLLKLAANTRLPIELMENLSSSLNSTGDNVWFRVADDVKADGQLVIPRGTPVKATIRKVHGGSSRGAQGTLDVALVSIDLEPSRRIAVIGQLASAGEERTAGMISGGLMGLLIMGTEAFHPAGSRFDAWIRDDNWLPAIKQPPVAASRPRTTTAPVKLALGANTRNELPPVELPFACASELTDVRLVSVGEWRLAEAVKASDVSREGQTCTARFDGWSVLRHVRPGVEREELHLQAMDGVDEIRVDVPVTLRVD